MAHLNVKSAGFEIAQPLLSAVFVTDFDYSGQAFRNLFERAKATAFQHPIWLKHFTNLLCPSRDAQSHTILLQTSTGRLIAALPLTSRRFSGARLLEAADLGVCDYCAPVIDCEWSDQDSLGKLMAAALPAHDIFRIRNIRPEFVDFFEALSNARIEPANFSAHSTRLETTVEVWRDRALLPSFQKTLARKVRKAINIEGVSVNLINNPNQAAAAVRKLAILRQGRFIGDMIAFENVADFYAEVAKDGTETGFARVYAININADTIGVLFGTCHNGALQYLLIGCDYANHGQLSPGMVLYDFAISDWIRAGGTEFDFTIGDEPFKMDFGTVATSIAGIETTASLKGQVALLARNVRDKLR